MDLRFPIPFGTPSEPLAKQLADCQRARMFCVDRRDPTGGVTMQKSRALPLRRGNREVRSRAPRIGATGVCCVALLVSSCGPSNDEIVTNFIAAHNAGDSALALSLVADSSSFRSSEQVQLALQSEYSAGPLEVTGDTVACELSQSSDLYRKLGVEKMHFPSWRFILVNGLIQAVEAEAAEESAAKFSEAMGRVQTWLQQVHPDLEPALLQQEAYFTLENHERWASVLDEWRAFEAPYLREIVRYDEFGRAHEDRLVNSLGLVVAKRFRRFSRYNSQQVTGEALAIRPELDSIVHNAEFRVRSDNRAVRRWLCLDQRGDVLKRDGQAVLVAPFSARQRSSFRRSYDGAYIVSQTTTIYPCSNCADETGEAGCRFVW